MATVSGTFTGVGAGTTNTDLTGKFNLSLSGFDQSYPAVVRLERSYDGGTTWKKIKDFSDDVEATDEEPEASGVDYRLYCSVHNYGTIAYRLGN